MCEFTLSAESSWLAAERNGGEVLMSDRVSRRVGDTLNMAAGGRLVCQIQETRKKKKKKVEINQLLEVRISGS